MKEPEIKDLPDIKVVDESGNPIMENVSRYAGVVGYNQAIEDYKAYHDHMMGQLPDADELYDIITNINGKYFASTNNKVALAIHDRIQEAIKDDI